MELYCLCTNVFELRCSSSCALEQLPKWRFVFSCLMPWPSSNNSRQFKTARNGERKHTRQGRKEGLARSFSLGSESPIPRPWTSALMPCSCWGCWERGDGHPTLTAAANREKRQTDGYNKSLSWGAEMEDGTIHICWVEILASWHFFHCNTISRGWPPQSQDKRHPLMSEKMRWAAASFCAAASMQKHSMHFNLCHSMGMIYELDEIIVCSCVAFLRLLSYMVAETKWVGLEVAEIQAPFFYTAWKLSEITLRTCKGKRKSDMEKKRKESMH